VDSWWAHSAYHKQLHLPEELLLLSDFNREGSGLYAGYFDSPSGFKQVARRAVFVIGQDGRVAYRWDNTDPPSSPAVDPVLDAVRALRG
jgi:peroxiredoxin